MITNLFNLIKNHKYTDIIKLIKTTDNINLNEPDDSGNYLIHYAILFKQIDILALLISKKCKLDILDNDGYGIFYIPIKMNYIEIIKMLLYFNNIVVGIPLLEFQDKYLNTPLNYAIKFKKIDIILEFLNSNINLNYTDLNGDTILHSIIPLINNDNIEIIKIMINQKISINSINKTGKNALHVSVENSNIIMCKILLEAGVDTDIGTIDYQLTPLLLSVKLNEYEICKLILKYNPNINYQSIDGNTALYIAIQNKSKQFIKLFLDNSNINLINIDGNSAIQLFFENGYDVNNLNDYFFKEILNKSKLNTQNNKGKTLFYYLVNDNIWEKYIDILLNKNINIYIQDINNITPYDIINTKFKDKKEKFIEMIAHSYINIYSSKSDKYTVNIECIKEYNTNLSDTEKSKRIDIIKQNIRNNKILYQHKKKTYCVNELDIKNIEFTTYIGYSLDILIGLIYIAEKFKNVQTTLTSDIIENINLEKYYEKNSIKRGLYGDFLNFEIIWSFQKLFYPTNLKNTLSSFIKNESKRYLIIPIGIELSNGAHANILIYDKNLKTIERFEPYGKDWPAGFNYNPTGLDHKLNKLFNNLLDNDNIINITYYEPHTYEQKIGFQTLDINEHSRENNIGDPGGFCAAWSLWYVEMRISNPNIDKIKLIPNLISYIRNKKLFFRSIIRSYTKHITDIRDELLLKSDLNINKWINDNYTEKQWNILLELLINRINKL